MGVHPAVEIAAATSYSPELDELELANRYMDGGLKVSKVNGLKVPADAEVVMFAEIKKDMIEEGPFVDLSKTWDIEREQPAVEVKELWMREEPYVRILLPGKGEHSHLMGVPQEPRIYKIVKNTVPTVKNVVLTKGGCSWLHGVVQIKKRNEGEPKNAGMAALAAHPSMKKVTVVDGDVDPSDPEEVEWATATRMQPDKDIILIKRAKGSSLDPSQDYDNRLMTKWIVDATAPFEDKDPENFERAKLAKEDEINLEDYR
jgi:UbiD family decarboxylase